jgi:hypothetical protein
LDLSPPNNRLHLTRASGTPACLRNLVALAGFAVPRPQVNLHVSITICRGSNESNSLVCHLNGFARMSCIGERKHRCEL